jgi:hypothetical protein
MTSRAVLRLARAIVRRYPAAWRERYEAELLALIVDSPPRWRDVVDLGRGSLVERARAVVEPAAHPKLAAAAVLAARYVLLPTVLMTAALGAGATLRWTFGPLSEAAADAAGVAALLTIAALGLAWLVRGARSVRAGTQRWSVGLAGGLAWLGLVILLLIVLSWTDGAPEGMRLVIWLYHTAIGTAVVLNRSRVRPGQQLLDTVNHLLVAREQLSWARMELTRCETLASEGAPVGGELARAQTELARWQTQHDEAMRALQSMGYRARLP